MHYRPVVNSRQTLFMTSTGNSVDNMRFVCTLHLHYLSLYQTNTHISRESLALSFITVQYYDVCKYWSTFWPDGCIRLFAHYHTTLSSLCRPIWRIELLKCLPGTFCLESVPNIKSILSIIFHAIYGVDCIQLTHFPYYDCENTCTLSYHHHQIGNMTHLPLFCLGLGHETMVNAACLSIFW